MPRPSEPNRGLTTTSPPRASKASSASAAVWPVQVCGNGQTGLVQQRQRQVLVDGRLDRPRRVPDGNARAATRCRASIRKTTCSRLPGGIIRTSTPSTRSARRPRPRSSASLTQPGRHLGKRHRLKREIESSPREGGRQRASRNQKPGRRGLSFCDPFVGLRMTYAHPKGTLPPTLRPILDDPAILRHGSGRPAQTRQLARIQLASQAVAPAGNGRMLPVTNSRPCCRAMAAIIGSAVPMGWPMRSSSPAMRPASSAAGWSKERFLRGRWRRGNVQAADALILLETPDHLHDGDG